jgi:hypothetical protein
MLRGLTPASSRAARITVDDVARDADQQHLDPLGAERPHRVVEEDLLARQGTRFSISYSSTCSRFSWAAAGSSTRVTAASERGTHSTAWARIDLVRRDEVAHGPASAWRRASAWSRGGSGTERASRRRTCSNRFETPAIATSVAPTYTPRPSRKSGRLTTTPIPERGTGVWESGPSLRRGARSSQESMIGRSFSAPICTMAATDAWLRGWEMSARASMRMISGSAIRCAARYRE